MSVSKNVDSGDSTPARSETGAPPRTAPTSVADTDRGVGTNDMAAMLPPNDALRTNFDHPPLASSCGCPLSR